MVQFKPEFFTDIRIEESTQSVYQFVQGEIDNVINRKRLGAFIRVFDGDRWYYGVTTDIDSIQKELDRLYSFATPNPDILNHPVIQKMPSHQSKLFTFNNDKVSDISYDRKIDLLKTPFHLLENYPSITLWQAIYIDKYMTKKIINSKGLNLELDWQNCGIVYFYSMRDGEKTLQEHYEMTADSFHGLKVDENALHEYLDKCDDFLKHSRTLEPGTYRTILSPNVAGVFAHESFGHKSESDFMIGDENMKQEWALGKRIGSENLSILDQGDLPGSGYIGYDDEGNRAGKTYLIKKGILTGRLHNTETAVALEEEPTGNARAMNFEYEPIVRMTCTFIEAGDLTKEELFAKVDRGIYIERIKHGSGMSTFTLAPSLAYMIENGKIAYPVNISVITGSVFETLKRIEALSDKIEITSFSVGGCGKMEQYPLPVSFGGPYVLVSEMNAQ